jgi:hypothetical protein
VVTPMVCADFEGTVGGGPEFDASGSEVSGASKELESFIRAFPAACALLAASSSSVTLELSFLRLALPPALALPRAFAFIPLLSFPVALDTAAAVSTRALRAPQCTHHPFASRFIRLSRSLSAAALMDVGEGERCNLTRA